MKVNGHTTNTITRPGSKPGVQSAGPASSLQAKPMPQISPLASFAAMHQVEELHLHSSRTRFTSTNGGLHLQAESRFDLHAQRETVQLAFDFSAEALGLTADYFKDGKSLEFNFSLQQRSAAFQFQSQTRAQKSLRPPTEIIQDLAKAVSDVMRQPGNKSIAYELDEEARQALSGDPRVMELLGQLVMIMSMINLLRDPYSPSDKYLIQISGKGKPVLQHQESTRVTENTVSLQVSIRIHPPAGQADS